MIPQDTHVRSLETSSTLSRYYMPQAILPPDVISVLNAASVKFMLVGAHGIGGWIHKPRATEDVDVIVATRHQKKAVRILLAAFPNLEPEDLEVVTRLRERDAKIVRIDIIKQNQPLFRIAFKHMHPVTSGKQVYNIPSLEMALAMKFAAMVSPNRREGDKHIDAHDFIHMIESNPEINVKLLNELGELVYAGGGDEVVEMVRTVRAGEKLVI